ncbi:MAG: hypothetical protein FVQ83_12160 [Chloroflexi bacterium]|nr:hypothetical protein [Chloroflexota bacterium]
MCLLIVSVAANRNWIELSSATDFMGKWWFIAIVVVFWVATVAPAYFSLIFPGIGNTINTLINFLSGFVVPVSAALISLASAGIITNLSDEAGNVLQTLNIFSSDGGVGATGFLVAGGGALIGSSLTGVKGVSKPVIGARTGTIGHTSASIFATVENIFSFVVMGLLYALAKINPWLLVILLGVVLIAAAFLVVYSIRQLRKIKTGLGRLFRLIQVQPKAGFAVLLEFFIWGSGWLIWGQGRRGGLMLLGWLAYGGLWWLFFTISSILTFLLLCFIPFSIIIFTGIGRSTARALMGQFDIPDELPPIDLSADLSSA